MELIHITVFIVGGLLYALIAPRRLRAWAMLIASVYAIYALQPTLDIRFLDFGLPTATLVMAVYGWLLTRPRPALSPQSPTPLRGEGELTSDDSPAPVRSGGGRVRLRFAGVGLRLPDIISILIIVLMACLLTIPRYSADFPLQPTSRPPDIGVVLVGLGIAAVVGIAIALVTARRQNAALIVGMIALVALFIIVKTEPFAVALAGLLRRNTGQAVELAAMPDIGWLGFSYVAFRILHTIRDRQSGLLPALGLREYLTYIIFFAAYTSGPIDRAERHAADDRALLTLRALDADRLTRAGTRIAVGLVKKFVIADTLALFSLNAVAVSQTDSTAALWGMLYVYAFRLYFDFSGYSDIAVGIGMIYGVQLPENFANPYAKNTITGFWQSWHMTLSSWARFYLYAPLSKALLRRIQIGRSGAGGGDLQRGDDDHDWLMARRHGAIRAVGGVARGGLDGA